MRALLVDDGRPLRERLAATSTVSGVSVRTLERWLTGYRTAGVAGLADSRVLKQRAVAIDPRWDAACLAVLREYVSASTPTMNVVIDRVHQRVDEEHGAGVVPCPSRATAYRRVTELSKGRHAFGSGKARRSVAERPQAPYGRLRPTRPGEYVVLDTTPLDVFAMEPVTLRWVPVEVTVAQDLFTRCILGLRLSPVSTKAADVANVLYQCVTPQPSGTDDGWWPFHGVPSSLLVGTEEPDGLSQQRVAGLPACLPEAIVVDHGKVYLSDHVIAACARLGITVQPAIPHKPTDKPTVERFFRTLRESLLQHLPAYKGPDVYNRGQDVEEQAFL
ncbi:MAG: integrase, partial [Dermatophilaceae bacterium]